MAFVEEREVVWCTSSKRCFKHTQKAAADNEVRHVPDRARAHGCDTPSQAKASHVNVSWEYLPEYSGPLKEDVAYIEGVQDSGPLGTAQIEVILRSCSLCITCVSIRNSRKHFRAALTNVSPVEVAKDIKHANDRQHSPIKGSADECLLRSSHGYVSDGILLGDGFFEVEGL